MSCKFLSSHLYLAHIFIIFFASLSFASKNDCSYQSLKKARSEFQKLYDQKKFHEASGLLSASSKKCSDKIDRHSEGDAMIYSEYCWVQSDLALSLYKEGLYFECRDLLGGTLDPRNSCAVAPAEAEGGFDQAISNNFELCEKAIQKNIIAGKCKAKLKKDDIASIGIIDSTKGKIGDEKACLVWARDEVKKSRKGQTQDELSEDEDMSCPSLYKVITGTAGKTTRSKISLHSDALSDIDTCCWVTKMNWIKYENKFALYLRSEEGPTPPCTGMGTMRSQPGVLLEWDGKSLKQIRNTTIQTH